MLGLDPDPNPGPLLAQAQDSAYRALRLLRAPGLLALEQLHPQPHAALLGTGPALRPLSPAQSHSPLSPTQARYTLHPARSYRPLRPAAPCVRSPAPMPRGARPHVYIRVQV
jgi:hypothetical protein